MKKLAGIALAGMMAVSMFGCGASAKKVEVTSAADLADLTVGVQTGTTGDSYATEEVIFRTRLIMFWHFLESSGEHLMYVQKI